MRVSVGAVPACRAPATCTPFPHPEPPQVVTPTATSLGQALRVCPRLPSPQTQPHTHLRSACRSPQKSAPSLCSPQPLAGRGSCLILSRALGLRADEQAREQKVHPVQCAPRGRPLWRPLRVRPDCGHTPHAEA